MTSPDVVLHIGLHKTATRFLQRAIFARLDPQQFLVNPSGLNRALKQALWYPSQKTREAARKAVASALQEAGDRTLLVSEPAISGDMYSSHEDWHANLEFIRELFPEARIIYFVRRQSDWLHSAYRQALVKGPGMPIEFFLNYRDGEFRPRESRMIGRARNVNAFDLRFAAIYKGYAEAFGAERVYLFRQEDLRNRSQAVQQRLAEALGIDALPEPPRRVSGNRAFSALAIHLFFPGVYRRPPRSRPNKHRFYWMARVDRRMKKIRTAFIRHVFDRLVYRDRDLLARHGMREQLENHYSEEDRMLSRVADEVLTSGPGERALSCVQGLSGGVRDA